MKKSIFLLFAAILCAMSAGAAQVTPNGKYFYFKTSSTWNVDNPRYSVYFAWRNGGGEDKTWASCKTVPGTTDILYVTAPGEFWDIYFCRMNGSTTDNKDANVWNKTDKLQYDGSKNFWTKSTGWNGTASYSIYVPAISSVTLLDNGTNIISGTGTQADPYLVYVETAIKVKGVGTKVLDDPDAKLNYNFKQGTTSKQESTSATYQFTASATADTEYIINLDGYTKVNTTKSNVTKSATALYYKTVERAEETNTVTISYKCGDKDVQTGITEVVGVSTTSSFTAPTNITGYKFTNWTIGAGIDLKAGTASDATITVVTKSASSDYTLVANYEEVKETVYFINTNKWSVVNLHRWGGTATETPWPGEAMTKTGEKIGEYDVYSFTAKQGAFANVIFTNKNTGSDQTADLIWTAGKYYIYNYGGKSDWYTKEEAEALLVVPVVTHDIVVKAVVPEVWNSGTISIHYWGDGISAPSKPVATEKDGNWNKYTIKNVPEGTSVSVIFINGADWSNNANQTADITGITEDKCFQISAAKLDSDGKCTVKEVDCDATIEPEVDVYTMMGAGELGLSWDLTTTGNDMTKQTDGTYTLVKEDLDLATAGSYEYKVVKNHSWDWSIPSGNTNQTLKVDKVGTYTVTFTLSADKKTLIADAVRNTRTVAVTAENGKVEGIENNGVYILGKEVTLTATANDHYVFVNWTKGEEVVSTENPYTFNVTADVALVANFKLDSHTVTVTAENGTVTGADTYEHGAEATLTATPAEGYEFVNWTENEVEVSTAAEYTFEVLADHNLVANFKKKTYTVTATAVNGSVTGLVEGGTYEHGATATLTATPAFDYQFVKWSNGLTENPLTITVTDNVTLKANFAEVAATEKKESGVFSISAHKTATFATGNLQYHTGNKTWRFAKQQYQVVGEQNIQLGHPDFTGWIDMLGYSADGKYGVNPSNKNEDYAGEFVDWGTLFPEEGWSTLSKEDWKYLLEERTNAATLQQVAKVGDILGIMLFPDNWTLPEDCNPTPEINHDPDDGEETKYDFTTQNYTLEQWTKLEKAGAVFLPAAGRRTGGWGNTTLSENVPGGVLDADGHYKHFDNCNEYAYYWTSTKVGENVNYLINCRLVDKPNNIYSVGAAHVDWAEKGRYGQSVRLAKVVYDKHTVNATAVNGTVTGLVEGGIYEHGATATLTATPAFDYEFVNWTVGEETITDNPLTITVAEDVTLKAVFAEVAPTEVKESGVFSISAHKTATFATGNLQYHTGNKTWRFAKQQYQVVGEQNIQLGHPDFTGWIDMLGYSADGKFGVNPSNANADYAEEFVDWGTLFPEEGWSTLSKEDWKYLLEERTNAATLQQVAKVGDILGIMLFPDNWTLPEDCNPTPEINHDPDDGEETKYDFTTQNYTLEQWTKLEKAGAVFLPAAGRRTGGWGNTTLSENVPGGVLDADGHYKHFDNCNEYAYYWTSTKVGENVNYLINCRLVDKPNNIYSVGAAHVDWAEKGRYGQSVRLAKVVYDKHTVTATAEHGTVTGADADEYTHGTEITLTAIPEEHYVFVNWTAGETVLSSENPYIFTLEKDVELTANFALDTHTVAAAAENGTVTGAGDYTHGTEVTLTATANEHYVFVNWTKGEEVVAETAEYTFTVEADVELVANFKLDSHTVAATAENGTVTGSGIYEHGATATLTATANEHYVFVNWTVGEEVVAETAEYTFTVEADVNLVANFKKQIVHTAITAEDAIVRLIDGVLYFNGVLEDGTPYQVTLNEYTEVGDYTNISWTTYGEDEVEVVGAQANVTDEEGKLILTATVTNETNSYGLTISGVLPAAEEDVKEVESLVYTLTPASGSNNGYAKNCDITIYGITWNLTGNSTMQPWRIGGKNLTNQDRALYSKTPLAYNISKIEVTHGTANNITVNSFKLIISDEVNGVGETIDVAFKASATTTIDLPEGDYTNKYFKFLYNVTVDSDNKYVQFTGAKFYATTTIEANPAPEAPAFTGEANFVGSTEVELTTTEENINIYYTLTDDYTLPTAGYMYAEPIELTETTTVKAIAHNTLTGKISEIAEKTFTKAELYTIKWSVNGEVSETTEVVQGNTLVLPADPTAPEACGSKVFMGWTTTSSVDANGIDITYVDNTTIPTADAIYYAVFAKTSISDSSEDKEVTLSIKEYAAANGWVNGTKYTSVVVDENVTATVSNGSNTGKYYTNGNEWRIYQSENATLTIAAKEGCMLKAINVIYNVGNTGTLLDAPSGIEVEVEAESVTFKVGNTKSATNGQVKITAMTITYNAGEAYTYSEYSTTCSGTGTDVENIEVKGKSVKMIVNGQLIIIKNGVTYNAQGQVVK